MMRAYSELYLSDAKENLAEFFDYGIRDCSFDPEFLSSIFVQSGYADKFERGNPAIVSGISGIELARSVAAYAYPDYEFPERTFSEDRSPIYWAGWALAEYQWMTCKRFKDIFLRISFSEILAMYHVFHEMDTAQFVDTMNERYNSVCLETNLKRIRKNRGVSQAELSRLSGVSLRSIEMYEQKVNNIDKAQAGTLYRLSRVLGCTMEDLLELND